MIFDIITSLPSDSFIDHWATKCTNTKKLKKNQAKKERSFFNALISATPNISSRFFLITLFFLDSKSGFEDFQRCLKELFCGAAG